MFREYKIDIRQMLCRLENYLRTYNASWSLTNVQNQGVISRLYTRSTWVSQPPKMDDDYTQIRHFWSAFDDVEYFVAGQIVNKM